METEIRGLHPVAGPGIYDRVPKIAIDFLMDQDPIKMIPPAHYRRVSKDKIRGWVNEEIYDTLPPAFFEDPVASIQGIGGKVLKTSKWRWAAIFILSNGQSVFFKGDKTKGRIESLKYLFLPSRGHREWLIAHQSQAQCLPIPRPLGWMERLSGGFVKESYYLSEAIGSGDAFIEDSARAGEVSSIFEMARTVRKIQDSGLFHRDLHGGNFIWEGASLFLTDLHGAKRIKTLSLDQRLWNLSHLFHSLRSTWGEKEQGQFIENYFEKDSIDPQEKQRCLRRIEFFMNRLQKRQWRSRTKRCLKESTDFLHHQEKGVWYFRRRDFPLDRLKKVIEEHRFLEEGRFSSFAKHSPRVIVSILDDEGDRLCVKRFRYPRLWDRMKEYLRHSKGLKCWIAGNGLMVRGIPSLRPLGLMEKKGLLGSWESFFLMEALERDQEMDRYMLRGFKDFNGKRSFVKNFARWLSDVHQKRVFHKDMKTCNILVSEREEEWIFHFIDLEDILLDEEMDDKKLFKNLLQLNTSTPRVMTRTDRLRFFSEYTRLHPVIKDRRGFLRALAEESKRRGLLYVSPEGVVKEGMP